MDILQDQAFLSRVRNIEWFSNVGNEIKRPSTFDIEYVKSWKQAKSAYLQNEWSEARITAKNEFTALLKKNHPDHYPHWDNLLRQARMFVQKEMQHLWETTQADNRLDEKFLTDVRTSVFYAFVERAYQDVVERQGFFLKILSIYESGNYPCGWKGDYPQGKLIVY